MWLTSNKPQKSELKISSSCCDVIGEAIQFLEGFLAEYFVFFWVFYFTEGRLRMYVFYTHTPERKFGNYANRVKQTKQAEKTNIR